MVQTLSIFLYIRTHPVSLDLGDPIITIEPSSDKDTAVPNSSELFSPLIVSPILFHCVPVIVVVPGITRFFNIIELISTSPVTDKFAFKLKSEFKSAVPGAPSAPVGPIGPCTPSEPSAPVGPIGPCTPSEPSAPVGPCTPSAPVGP